MILLFLRCDNARDGWLYFSEMIKGNPNISHIPVILLTSKTDIDNRLEGIEKGADAYIAKPFSMEELHVTIDNLSKNMQRLRGKFSGALIQEERIKNKKY